MPPRSIFAKRSWFASTHSGSRHANACGEVSSASSFHPGGVQLLQRRSGEQRTAPTSVAAPCTASAAMPSRPDAGSSKQRRKRRGDHQRRPELRHRPMHKRSARLQGWTSARVLGVDTGSTVSRGDPCGHAGPARDRGPLQCPADQPTRYAIDDGARSTGAVGSRPSWLWPTSINCRPRLSHAQCARTARCKQPARRDLEHADERCAVRFDPVRVV